jgi:F-type H+-transporting ATPase subunit delta
MAERLTLARPYAEAVFRLAQEDNAFAQWSDVLQSLALIASDDQMQDIISNPETDDEALFGLIVSVTGKLESKAENLVRVLMENNRLILMPEIAQLYEEQRAQAEASVDVEISSAVKLDAEQEKVIAAALEKKLGKKIKLSSNVDESLIGGVVIHAGDLVIDGSVKGRLGELASHLIH